MKGALAGFLGLSVPRTLPLNCMIQPAREGLLVVLAKAGVEDWPPVRKLSNQDTFGIISISAYLV